MFLYAVFCVSVAAIGLWYLLLNRFDKNWNMPSTIATEFVKIAQKGECRNAAEYWTEEGLEDLLVKVPYLEDFDMYCLYSAA